MRNLYMYDIRCICITLTLVVIISTQMGIGYGKDQHGAQKYGWSSVVTAGAPTSSSDLTADEAFEHFSGNTYLKVYTKTQHECKTNTDTYIYQASHHDFFKFNMQLNILVSCILQYLEVVNWTAA